MKTGELLKVRRDVSLDEGNGVVTLTALPLRLTLGEVSPGVREAVHRLLDGATEEEVFNRAVARDGFVAVPYVTHLLQRMEANGMLCRTILTVRGPLATIVPLTAKPVRAQNEIDLNIRYSLCRFAFVHKDGDALLLESPRRDFRIELHDVSAVQVIFQFTSPFRVADAHGSERFIPLLQALVETGFLLDSSVPEAEADRRWEFHDLLFHTRSRLGRNNRPYGATYRFLDELPPLPAVKEPMAGEAISLARPDLEALARSDAPLARVVEERRSIRTQGKTPISIDQLAELLYRTARVRRIFSGPGGELSSRPYPGGGAIYELEIYPAVDRCDGLPSGLYHYCPLRHALEPVAARTPAVERLLDNSYRTLNQESRPQVVLMITARFGRVTAKYESMAYALILKDVGVLYQTLYLNATAMGLAPCALGGGDSEVFASASGLDPFTEGAVGELAVGTREEVVP